MSPTIEKRLLALAFALLLCVWVCVVVYAAYVTSDAMAAIAGK